MKQKNLIICFDGLDPDYLKNIKLPAFQLLIHDGFMSEGQCVMPSVTNVNNISIITGTFPGEHGITSNFYYDSKSKQGEYMESPEYLRADTIFKVLSQKGLSSALLTSKDKLRHMLEPGAGISISAENPTKELIDAVGPPRSIYSAEINYWLLDAAALIINKYHPDLVYATSTDYMMHKYPPGAPEMTAYLLELDRHLAQVIKSADNYSIYVTADHGMSAKSRGVDLAKYLAIQGITATFIPVIKDRYVVHHENLGGIAYLYLAPSETEAALACLRKIPGIEEVYVREKAAAEFRLLAERIGDIVVLGDQETVFGSFSELALPIKVRSHGSRHESRVPIIGYKSHRDPADFKYNLDVVRNLDIT
jgi:phosphonoacetate hydrolase